MSDEARKLRSTARQVLEGELLFSDPFLPAGRNPLPPPAAPSSRSGMTAEERATALEAMDVNEVRICTRCRLHQGRTQTVFGEGSPSAEIVFIGEGPGEEEDRTGRPFVGRAGELLTRMVAAMGLRRSDVYICNIIKCRAPGNRSPAADEADACRDYLLRQLQIIAPKVIVTLGNPATQKLLDTTVGITKLRGQWQKLPLLIPGLSGIEVMPTFHPAFVLRQYTADVRGKVWADLQEVMARVGLPTPPRRKGGL